LNLIAISRRRKNRSPSRFEVAVRHASWCGGSSGVVLVTPMLLYSGNIKKNWKIERRNSFLSVYIVVDILL
jgi:hypothetical protein